MRKISVAASVLAMSSLSGCWDDDRLPDTLLFPPGTEVVYQGQSAKIYGNSQCAQYGLTGHTCLIFSPQSSEAAATIIRDGKAMVLELKAQRDPQDPTRFVVVDTQGQRILSTSGRHDERANLRIMN